jgi:hypothetical protein
MSSPPIGSSDEKDYVRTLTVDNRRLESSDSGGKIAGISRSLNVPSKARCRLSNCRSLRPVVVALTPPLRTALRRDRLTDRTTAHTAAGGMPTS